MTFQIHLETRSFCSLFLEFYFVRPERNFPRPRQTANASNVMNRLPFYVVMFVIFDAPRSLPCCYELLFRDAMYLMCAARILPRSIVFFQDFSPFLLTNARPLVNTTYRIAIILKNKLLFCVSLNCISTCRSCFTPVYQG